MASQVHFDNLSYKGILFASRIRAILLVLASTFIAASSAKNPRFITVSFSIGLVVFAILTLTNYIFAKKQIRSSFLNYTVVFMDVLLPLVMKSFYAFAGEPATVLNENFLFVYCFFVLLLTMVQNQRRFILFAGSVFFIGYVILVLLCLYVWDVPTRFGERVAGTIRLEYELLKTLMIPGFTLVATVITRNARTYFDEAIRHEEVALERAGNLVGVIVKAREISGELADVTDEQKEIGTKLVDISKEQAEVSSRMSSSFQDLNSIIESINRSMKSQKEEGLRDKELTDILKNTQGQVRDAGDKVTERISHIVNSTDSSRENLDTMLKTMEIISQGGEEIGNFLEIINNITEQINLLSMNASIEAARAGEHGRGFAVVATEISKLADATARNAQEISTKIQSILASIVEGRDRAQLMNESTADIFNSVSTINDRMGEVREYLEKQGVAIEEVVLQSSVVNETANIVAETTREQLLMMEENVETVRIVSDMSQRIADYNQSIQKLTGVIGAKSHELENLVSQVE